MGDGGWRFPIQSVVGATDNAEQIPTFEWRPETCRGGGGGEEVTGVTNYQESSRK
jgi:hypothetical protein